MRRCHGNRGVLFQKCQIVLLSSHFSDNLVSLSLSHSLTHTTVPKIVFCLSLPLSLPSTRHPEALPWTPAFLPPRRKWPDQFHPRPLPRPASPSCDSGPRASPLWERCLPHPSSSADTLPPLGVCWSVLVSFYFARYENET